MLKSSENFAAYLRPKKNIISFQLTTYKSFLWSNTQNKIVYLSMLIPSVLGTVTA